MYEESLVQYNVKMQHACKAKMSHIKSNSMHSCYINTRIGS